MKLCCTSNDCGSRKSRLPKLGLIELGPLPGRQNGPRVVHECSPRTRSTKVVRGPGVRVLSFPI